MYCSTLKWNLDILRFFQVDLYESLGRFLRDFVMGKLEMFTYQGAQDHIPIACQKLMNIWVNSG